MKCDPHLLIEIFLRKKHEYSIYPERVAISKLMQYTKNDADLKFLIVNKEVILSKYGYDIFGVTSSFFYLIKVRQKTSN